MDWARRRHRMVERYVRARGVESDVVLEALRAVPRHKFVEEALWDRAYGEDALPIGAGQTISRPYIVARMTELLQVHPDQTVLEIGTGSGYQAAVLAKLARVVYTVERIPALADRAARIFRELRLQNIFTRVDDGSVGWAAAAPFPRIIVTAGSASLPDALLEQLDPEEGRMVVPVASGRSQTLMLVRRSAGRTEVEEIEPCEFVPLVRGR